MTRRWSAIPADIAEDDRLTALHLRIIIAMAGSVKRGSDIASIGGRLLAKVVRKSQPTIWRRQQELVTWGWLAPVFQAKGKRTEYRIVGYPIWKKSESSARTQRRYFPTRETGRNRPDTGMKAKSKSPCSSSVDHKTLLVSLGYRQPARRLQ
jgi:hypothetical protein